VKDLDIVFVPIGLGSGACGIIAAREALGLKTRIVGVVSSHAPAYALSFRQRRLVTQPSTTRVAEGVACSTPNELALGWLSVNVEDIVTIADDEALDAMHELFIATHNVAEGAGAIAWAAIRKQRDSLRGLRVGCVLSGGNAASELFVRALSS
jgi:threonine dehydratase